MIIQEVGTEILNHTPKQFYVFCGSEYGINKKYMSILKEHYGKVYEYAHVEDVLNLMSTMHIIPLEPALYIVRYDVDFLSTLSDTTEDKIASTDIIGTVICIYELDKHTSKLSKFLKNYTVRIDPVTVAFKNKYLRTDFPELPNKFTELAAQYSVNYNDAMNMCKSMSAIPTEELFSITDIQLLHLLGKHRTYTDEDIRIGIASRNFRYLITVLKNYESDLDKLFYTILSTMIELEKLFVNKKISSDLRDYVDKWTIQDVYNMFMNTYNELQKLRSYATDVESSLIYLFALLKFSQIPSLEVMGN